MQEGGSHESDERDVKSRVLEGLDQARQFARTMDFDEVKSGEWFIELLRKVVHAYDRNARAEYFQKKYPGLSPDEIADILISVTARYATVAGGVAGAAATSAQVTTLTTAGMTAPLFFGAIGAEMVYLARIQMRLVLDLTVVYDLQLDPEDPEDLLMVFGYALGVAPVDMLGTAATKAAGGGTRTLVKKYVSKHVLKSIQDFARKLGFKILQRTVIKYAVPVASAAVGGGYNYVSTRSVGKIAKTHFKRRGKFTEELQRLVSRKNTYDVVFPAAALYMSNLDGKVSPEQKSLYRSMLTRMTFEEYTQEEFQRLVENEEDLINAATSIEDERMRYRLVDVLVLMAICDGDLAEEERGFLRKISGRLEVSLNLEEVEKRSSGYRRVARESMPQRAMSSARDAATMAGGRARSVLGEVLARKGAYKRDRSTES